MQLVGSFSGRKRIVNGAVDPLNAVPVTMTILFLGSSPVENVTVQGSHDFGSGNQVGSVSAASPSRAAYIGQPYTRIGNQLVLGAT